MGTRRQPHDLGPDDLVWDFFSRPRDEPMLARVQAAAEAGFAGLGMYLGAWLAMREDAAEVERFEQALDDKGLVVANIEVVRGWASPDVPNEQCLAMEAVAWDIADHFGCRYVQAIGDYEGTIDEAARGFGALCDRAADHGLLVGLEAVPAMTNIDTVTLAARIVAEADRPNGGLCFDSWHLTRSTNDLDEIRSLPGDKIMATQWNDGTIEPTFDDYYTDTLTTRVPPGAGEFALVEMLRIIDHIGSTAPLGLEVPSTALWQAPIGEAAASVVEGMRKVIAGARSPATDLPSGGNAGTLDG